MGSTVENIIHHKYDVFLSFRGEDTRHSFTDHLYDALLRAGLRTFRDNDSIDRGQQLQAEIKKAILESRSSIIVLSENYANSRWCLDELVLILEQRRNFNHYVLPVFYHVDPSDVRNQRCSFAIESDPKWREVNDVNRWKSALTEVADLTGMVVSGSETEFIRKIKYTVYGKLLKRLSTPAHLTGIDTRAEVINSWLRTDQSSAEALAICGMGGIGKTTLAQYIYNSHKQNFESSSFLMEVGKHYRQPNGLLGLQKQLLADISGLKNEMSFCFPEVTSQIEDVLQMKKVLIVLDDIDDQDQIGALLGTKILNTKIKIIITTRDLGIRAWFRSISCKCQVYKLKLLNDQESLEVFSSHAFGSKDPMEDFKDLAVQFAKYCEGNPLALKVLGSSLYVSAEDPQERCINNWISTRNLLMSFKGDLDSKILSILKKSYDSLVHFSHRELFLHIAFFFVGQYEDDLVQILECDWHARAGITTLINRCLLSIIPSKKLMMHQLLQEIGRAIVHEESKDPAKRSRVCQDDSNHVLRIGEGSQTIEGRALDMRKIDQCMEMESELGKKAIDQSDVLYLDELKEGSVGPVIAMVARKWDVHKPNGDYLGTDFIISDEKGNLMHCFSRHNKSYKFVYCLHEGGLFTLKGFKVHDNRKEFRIFEDAKYILEFTFNTSVGKANGDVTRFRRHAFQLIPFESLVPTKNKYVVDVMGYVTTVGEPLLKSNGARTVEFNFKNESGIVIRVTLWGKLGDQMIKRKLQNPGPYSVILTCMTAKIYMGSLGVSSTSSSQIIDSDDVPALQSFKSDIRGRNLDQLNQEMVHAVPTVNTLAELLAWGRNWKHSSSPEEKGVLFKSTIEIVNVRTKNWWYLVTCNSGRCRKVLTRDDGGFKCIGCDTRVAYPQIRFKIELDIRDESASTVVVLFDEPSERLLNRSAKSLMDEELKDDSVDDIMPPVLRNLIGMKHVFEIKGHSYYNVREYEAFNCSQVIMPVIVSNATEGTSNPASDVGLGTSSTALPKDVVIVTPAKDNELRKRKMPTKGAVASSVESGKKKGKADSASQNTTRRLSLDADPVRKDITKNASDLLNDVGIEENTTSILLQEREGV